MYFLQCSSLCQPTEAPFGSGNQGVLSKVADSGMLHPTSKLPSSQTIQCRGRLLGAEARSLIAQPKWNIGPYNWSLSLNTDLHCPMTLYMAKLSSLESCHIISFLAPLLIYNWQLRIEMVYFRTKFRVTVYCIREGKALGAWEKWSYHIQSQVQRSMN